MTIQKIMTLVDIYKKFENEWVEKADFSVEYPTKEMCALSEAIDNYPLFTCDCCGEKYSYWDMQTPIYFNGEDGNICMECYEEGMGDDL